MEDERKREALEAVITDLEAQLWGQQRDLKDWETYLARADADRTKAGKAIKEAAVSVKREIRQKIASSLFAIELTEIKLESARADLADLEEDE